MKQELYAMKQKLFQLYDRIPEHWRHILGLFIASRAILTLIGVVSRITLEPFHGAEYVWVYTDKLWLDIWGVWDTGYYINIADFGYSAEISQKAETLNQANYAFFPLYPSLMRALFYIVGSTYYSGIIISNICLLIAAHYLYKLVTMQDGREVGLRSVKYMFLFPTAFVFSGVFTESIFLALLLAMLYYAKNQNWWLVGILGFFLSLTRSVGVLSLIPASYEYLRATNFFPNNLSFKDFSPKNFALKNFSLRQIKKDILYLLLIPLGLASFMAYNYFLTHDALAFVHIQSAWGRQLMNPVQLLYSNLFFGNIYEVLLASMTLIAIWFLVINYKKVELPHSIMGLLLILSPLMTGLASMPRYLLVVFPFYIILAKLSRNSLIDQLLTIILALLQGFLMVFWSNGFPLVM